MVIKHKLITIQFRYLLNFSNDISDEQIWEMQSISPELSLIIEDLIMVVWNHFMNPVVKGINITQWCKKEDCWKLLKNRYKNKLI